MKKRILAMFLVAAMSISALLSSCSGETKNKTTEDAASEPVTVSYVSENLEQFVINAEDIKTIFGMDDEIFAVFQNLENVKNAAVKVSIFDEESSTDFSLAASEETDAIRIDAVNTYAYYNKPVDVSLYIDNDKFAMGSKAILGTDTNIGIEFSSYEEFVEKVQNSDLVAYFSYMSGMEAPIDVREVFEGAGITEEYVNNLSSAFETYVEEFEQREAEAERAMNELITGLCGEVTEETIEVDGKKIDAIVVNASFDKEDFLEAFRLGEEYSMNNNESTNELLESIASVDPYAVIETKGHLASYGYSDMLEYLLASVEINGTEKLYINAATGKEIKDECVINVFDGKQNVVINIDGNVVDNGIVYTITTELSENKDDAVSLEFSITNKSTKNAYNLTILLKDNLNAANSFKSSFDVDKKNKTFTFVSEVNTEDNETESIALDGKINYSADSFGITVEKAYKNGEQMNDVGLGFEYTTGKAVEQPSNFSDIFDLTANEFFGIVASSITSFSDIYSQYNLYN